MSAGPATARAQVTATLKARPATKKLHGTLAPSELWTYDGRLPGTPLRFSQGAQANVRLVNGLKEPTSIHWHGIRTANAMDGVPYLTQEPVGAGGRFTYAFRTDDAGTFFYHPHINSAQQVGMGLFGALIVDEARPIAVDRDETWVMNDWRFGRDNRLDTVFGRGHSLTHGGRIGNLVTVNGAHDPVLEGQRHSRFRLRLINAATGRIFHPDFGPLKVWVVALDGQPIEPRRPAAGDLLIGPGMRVDLIVDLPDMPGKTVPVTDRYYSDDAYRMARIRIGDRQATRGTPLAAPARMADNPIPRFDPARATRHSLVFAGGAMGGVTHRGRAAMRRHMHAMMQRRLFWVVNDRLIPPLSSGQSAPPLFRLKRNGHYLLRMENHTAFDHPIHLHGHSFQVLARNGIAVKGRELRDTVLMRSRDRIDIGFVADNPGKWMFHCHILSHAAAGMGGVIEVG